MDHELESTSWQSSKHFIETLAPLMWSRCRKDQETELNQERKE